MAAPYKAHIHSVPPMTFRSLIHQHQSVLSWQVRGFADPRLSLARGMAVPPDRDTYHDGTDAITLPRTHVTWLAHSAEPVPPRVGGAGEELIVAHI